MPKKKLFTELSKSQKNRRLRQLLLKSENSTKQPIMLLNDCTGHNSLSKISTTEYSQMEFDNNIDYNGNDMDNNSSDYDSDNSCDEDNNFNIVQYAKPLKLSLRTELAQWVNECGITHDATNKLLKILKNCNLEEVHKNLPMDSRTLLSTPQLPIKIREVAPGHYFHYGLHKALLDQLKLVDYNSLSYCILININIDGLPIAKSSTSQLYPILAEIHPKVLRPFVIGIYHGYEKPHSCQSFLEDFLDEYKILSEAGFSFKNKDFKVKIRAIICDSPARSFVTCTKLHSGYFGCGKCRDEGHYKNYRILFLDMNAALRTDENFVKRVDEDHHLDISPFENAGIGMVSQFPLDYMHNVCLGVTKKVLLTFVEGPHRYKFSARQIEAISVNLTNIARFIPKEFARKPRQLKYVHKYKATEFRQFLLYSGPSVLESYIPIEYLRHFIVLHCAIRILCHKEDCLTNNNYAKDLLRFFVENCSKLYGEEFLIYNTHNLIHLPNDVLNFGHLDSFSAFSFENYLFTLKKKLKKPGQPLQQLYRRIVEQAQCDSPQISSSFNQFVVANKNLEVSKKLNVSSYDTINYEKFSLTVTSQADRFCYLQNDTIVRVENICIINGNTILTGVCLINSTGFPNYPIDSRKLKIFLGNEWSQSTRFNAVDVKTKAVCIPYKMSFYFLPFIH